MDARNLRSQPTLRPAQARDCAAVLLIAHGSRRAEANDELHKLVERVTAWGTYPIVEAGFLELVEPNIVTAGDTCVARGATCVLMIPYLLSSGIHLVRDLTVARDELRRRHPSIEVQLGCPLGPHPLLDKLVAERIREVDPRNSQHHCIPETHLGASDIDTIRAKH